MKQNITEKQWNAINPEKQMKFIIALEEKPEIITYEYEHRSHHPRWGSVLKEVKAFRPRIGQMVEFLEDDDYLNTVKDIDALDVPDKLCDALWETVKYKLT